MADKKKKITLYFTHGSELTDKDVAIMDSIPNPRHRNASYIEAGGKLEPCDFVAGPAVPEDYEHIPRADEEVDYDKDDEEVASSDMTAPQLKKALTELGVEFAKNASKAALVLLYDKAIAEE